MRRSLLSAVVLMIYCIRGSSGLRNRDKRWIGWMRHKSLGPCGTYPYAVMQHVRFRMGDVGASQKDRSNYDLRLVNDALAGTCHHSRKESYESWLDMYTAQVE